MPPQPNQEFASHIGMPTFEYGLKRKCEKHMDKQQTIITVIVGILLLAVIGATVAVFLSKDDSQIGKFVPPADDPTAIVGFPAETDSSAQYSDVKVNDSFVISLALAPLYKDGGAQVFFASDANNTVNTLVRLYDSDGKMIGESGLVKPGEYVESVAISLVPTKTTSIFAKVLSYEKETYYSMGTTSGELILRVE